MFGPCSDIFGQKSFISESLKGAWDQESLIDKQNLVIGNYTSSWTFNIQSFT